MKLTKARVLARMDAAATKVEAMADFYRGKTLHRSFRRRIEIRDVIEHARALVASGQRSVAHAAKVLTERIEPDVAAMEDAYKRDREEATKLGL